MKHIINVQFVCILACNCSPFGSNSVQCDQTTGQCPCGLLFAGRDCSSCIEGYGNVTAGCRECDCDMGAMNDGLCDPVSGVCRCAPGVIGFRCDRCDVDHYGLSGEGCKGKCSLLHALFTLASLLLEYNKSSRGKMSSSEEFIPRSKKVWKLKRQIFPNIILIGKIER